MAEADLVAANLVRIAAEALAGARSLATIGNRKAIRAVLTTESIHAGIGHDLRNFVDLIPYSNPVKGQLRGIEHLGAFATAYRYPSPQGRIKPAPSQADFEKEAVKVDAVIREIANRLGVDLAKANSPAAKSGPIR